MTQVQVKTQRQRPKADQDKLPKGKVEAFLLEKGLNGMQPTAVDGISIGSSGLTTYTIQYFNGARTYTERFALIRFEPFYVAAAGGSVAAAINAAAGALATIPVVGEALGGLLELAASWYGGASVDADGSLTVQLAYHYCGTKAGGVDLTAQPVPGVNSNQWAGTVNGFLNFAQG
jgi:hypothetical protein